MILLPDNDFNTLKTIFNNLSVVLSHATASLEENASRARIDKKIATLRYEAKILKKQNNSPQIARIEGENDDMPKLKYGDGSITLRQKQRKDGTIRRYYQGRIYIDGKQKSVYAKTKGECLQKMKDLRSELVSSENSFAAQSSEKLPNAHPATLSNWLDEWLKEFKEDKTRRRYFKDLCRYVDKLKASLGNLKLKRIEPMELQHYFNSLPRTNSTAKLYGVLKDCLQRAEDFGMIKKNPCKVVPKPSYRKGKRRPFELEEQNAILESLSPRYKAVFFFLCATGLRIGEFLALSPQSVDFRRKCISVDESQDLETQESGETKTEAGVRKVYFTEELFDYFDIASLGSYTYNAIKKAFSKVYKALGIEGISATHSCRHTFASLLYAVGVPEKVIQKQCGHADFRTTLDVYTDILAFGENSAIYEYILKLKVTLADHYKFQ